MINPLPRAFGRIKRTYVTPRRIAVPVGACVEFFFRSGPAIHARQQVSSPYRLSVVVQCAAPYGYATPRRQLAAIYALRVAAQRAKAYTSPIRQQLTSPLYDIVMRAHSAGYSLLVPVQGQVASVYEIKEYATAQQQNAAGYGMRTIKKLRADYGDLQRIRAGSVAPYSIRTRIAWQASMPYVLAIRVIDQCAAGFDLAELNRAQSAHGSIYDLVSVVPVVITDQPVILLDGQQIKIETAEISIDEEGLFWIARITLADILDYQRFAINDAFSINLIGEYFEFIVDSKTRERPEPAKIEMVLNGKSPAAAWDAPRSLPMTKTWSAAILASDAAIEAIGGMAITWDLIDWVIPAGRLAVSNASPIRVAQQIVTAAGGVLESLPDGSLRARHRYPVSVPDYPQAVPDHVLTDGGDIFDSSESFEARELIDKLAIRDEAEGSAGYTVEYQADDGDPYQGTVRIYPSPWRTNLDLAHTGLPQVAITPLGVVEREEYELVEFVDGRGQARYPICALVAVIWHYRNLGSLDFSMDSRELSSSDPVERHSMAWVRYRTRSLDFRVSDPQDETIQFLAMEA